MEDYKVLVSGESKSEEVQDLFFELGCEWGTCGNSYNKMVSVGHYIFSTDSNMLNYGLGIGRKEITLQQLRDLVGLNRNEILDANYESENTSIQDKLKFIEKWLNGEKIQYILGIETEKTQWHNFTEGDMQYIKRPDIKFRKAPKYVTINGIEFNSVKSLLKHVKNNFDLEDGEN